MLKSLKDLFDALAPARPAASPEAREHTLQLATAVLLVEVMRADARIEAAERSAAVRGLRERFGLADDEVERLLEAALRTAREAADYYSFTSRINQGFDETEKVRIVESLWQVVWADGRLSGEENHVMRKLADLLYIPQGPYIGAKMRAKRAAGAG